MCSLAGRRLAGLLSNSCGSQWTQRTLSRLSPYTRRSVLCSECRYNHAFRLTFSPELLHTTSSMIAKAGERMPVACKSLTKPYIHEYIIDEVNSPTDRYKRVLYDTLAHICGPQFVEPLPANSYHRSGYIVPSEAVYADPAPSMVSLFNGMLLPYTPPVINRGAMIAPCM